MLLDGKTIAELVAMRHAIETDPNNRNPPGSPQFYTQVARDKCRKIDRAILDNLRQEILNNLHQAQLDRGEAGTDAGYSGYNSNR